VKQCKHLLKEIAPNYHTTLYCRVLHTEVQRREAARMCAKCMYYEEADNANS